MAPSASISPVQHVLPISSSVSYCMVAGSHSSDPCLVSMRYLCSFPLCVRLLRIIAWQVGDVYRRFDDVRPDGSSAQVDWAFLKLVALAKGTTNPRARFLSADGDCAICLEPLPGQAALKADGGAASAPAAPAGESATAAGKVESKSDASAVAAETKTESKSASAAGSSSSSSKAAGSGAASASASSGADAADLSVLRCGHSFHQRCFEAHAQLRTGCPVCRQ